jgi:protein subunit release factor B
LYIFTPSKKDALLIVAGGQTMNFLTTDSSATQIPHEVLNFVVSELKYMSEEAKVDLGVSSAKDKILEEAKKMTTEELLKKINEDENFRKIVLDK